MIGSTKLTFLFVSFLAAYCPGQRRVIALLDGGSGMIGRTVSGIRIVGSPDHLQPIIDEFAEHGISTDRVVVGGDRGLFIRGYAERGPAGLRAEANSSRFRPEAGRLDRFGAQSGAEGNAHTHTSSMRGNLALFHMEIRAGFRQCCNHVGCCAPFLLLAGGLALLDVGWPILFWQQRLGARGRPFVIYKLRTLRPPFDQLGDPIPDSKRLSWVGTILRRTRLDELPQLFNVLVGDMSLIGPRPLLPRDQPANPHVRLMIRPGITGWAQVNGGTLLSPSEKNRWTTGMYKTRPSGLI